MKVELTVDELNTLDCALRTVVDEYSFCDPCVDEKALQKKLSCLAWESLQERASAGDGDG